MKIGLLTFPLNNNYGNLLQAYALMTVLKRMGHDVWLIDRKIDKSKPKARFRLLKEIIKIVLKYIFGCKNIVILSNLKIHRISRNMDIFKNKYLIPRTKSYYNSEELKGCLDYNFNCFIVGSDQVWRKEYFPHNISDFFFNFLNKIEIKRFSYAASFGIDENEYSHKEIVEYAGLLSQFKAVSVREMSGIRKIHEDFYMPNIDVKFVLDPTMLLSSQDYDSLINTFPAKNENKYLFCYILDNNTEIEGIISKTGKKLNCQTFHLQAQTGNLAEQKILAPVEEWLRSIKNAEFVITDSFHGTVFSIIFNKPFLVYGNKARGISRFESLLDLLNLKNRLVFTSHINENLLKVNSINWELVNDKIIELRRKSYDFLRLNLTN
jgi:hypothetical protein